MQGMAKRLVHRWSRHIKTGKSRASVLQASPTPERGNVKGSNDRGSGERGSARLEWPAAWRD
jgi:hypothetical protein